MSGLFFTSSKLGVLYYSSLISPSSLILSDFVSLVGLLHNLTIGCSVQFNWAQIKLSVISIFPDSSSNTLSLIYSFPDSLWIWVFSHVSHFHTPKIECWVFSLCEWSCYLHLPWFSLNLGFTSCGSFPLGVLHSLFELAVTTVFPDSWVFSSHNLWIGCYVKTSVHVNVSVSSSPSPHNLDVLRLFFNIQCKVSLSHNFSSLELWIGRFWNSQYGRNCFRTCGSSLQPVNWATKNTTDENRMWGLPCKTFQLGQFCKVSLLQFAKTQNWALCKSLLGIAFPLICDVYWRGALFWDLLNWAHLFGRL